MHEYQKHFGNSEINMKIIGLEGANNSFKRFGKEIGVTFLTFQGNLPLFLAFAPLWALQHG